MKKLMRFAGKKQAQELERHLYIDGRIKPENKSIFYTSDVVYRAVNSGKMTSFVCFEYNTNKELVPKHGGELYIFSPYAIAANQEIIKASNQDVLSVK